MTGTHLAHDVGYLEAGLTTSPEMIVLCAEIISMMRTFAGGMRLDAESLALDVIHQAGPGGSHLATEHTLRHFRETWQPGIFGRHRLADWIRRGGVRLAERLRDKTVALMASHVPSPLPGNVRDEVAHILDTTGPT